jgi:GNAT superfamily N-acetyltransferase
MYIEQTANPNSKDIDFLTDKINQGVGDFKSIVPFGLFIKDENKQIIAGLNGYFIHGVIHTDQLWVDPGYRKRGLGRKLMEKVDELGRKEQCQMATICTMCFLNVQKFYEKLGYVVDFVRFGYANGSNRIFLMKKL